MDDKTYLNRLRRLNTNDLLLMLGSPDRYEQGAIGCVRDELLARGIGVDEGDTRCAALLTEIKRDKEAPLETSWKVFFLLAGWCGLVFTAAFFTPLMWEGRFRRAKDSVAWSGYGTMGQTVLAILAAALLSRA